MRGRYAEGLLAGASMVAERLGAEERHELVATAAARSRRLARNRYGRLKQSAWQIVQAAMAAAAAWLVAKTVLGHTAPFFAPLAALIVLTATRGQRVRQAVELTLGVAIGVGVGDILIGAIGGGVVQLALVVSLAMCAATLLNASGILFTEAAISAALVATVEPSTHGFPPIRFLDAMIGGAVALLLSQVLFPVHPLRVVERAARSVLEGLAETLGDVADALERRDRDAAAQALLQAREISDDWAGYQRALDVGDEAARFAPRRRRLRGRLAQYQEVELPLDLLVRDVQVLARVAVRTLEIGDPLPRELVATLRDLALASRRVAADFQRSSAGAEAEELALWATRVATAAVPDENLSRNLLAGHTQATAADLLRTLGHERREAHARVGRAAQRARRPRAPNL
jgi:uncharacterized membrane protein YgaE (UPF0421/DUF939 family)